ncbi:serine/threonine-protein kinase [Streptomyces sp. NBC_00140]|uniref:serine/threonine-protein kinase n=1 Tax=Streptomyces sp. NBC_00140 TaxID=2975664 RepID=UPI00224C9CE6|nr:serine/threonine-protein kinase [Streptomyces sp. NBC_00140]MCX5330556.1 serine/threonine protein kinase [Streptomyces sp. NBC_00140]
MHNAADVFQPLQVDDPPVVAGYRLAARLGAGGMGRVYLSHTAGGRPLAIKVVRPELADDPDFRRRFGREIKAARRVRGAYTAELIDADADARPPWLATLYIPGPSLAEAVHRRGPLPVPAVLWLMAGVAEALQAIHGEGIVHRDLKPSNVLLAADGPRVIDFGISLAADTTAYTATGAAVGTPQFMAPEQAVAGDITSATDVFALGQTAAFAALGSPLYGDGPSATILYRIVHSEPDLSRLPEPLRPLLTRCLARDPQERATLAEVVEWCRQRLGGDADAGAGPAVWREVTGPEVTVPAPVPDPTPVHTMPLIAPARATVPAAPERGRGRRRRTGLIAGGVVAAGALLVTGLVWKFGGAADGAQGRDSTASSSTPDATASGRAAGASASTGADAEVEGAAGEASSSPSVVAGQPQVKQAFSPVSLNEKNSLYIDVEKPNTREDRKGDIRFACEDFSCSLKSDNSQIVQVLTGPGTTYKDCRFLLTGATGPTYRNFSLAAAAAGTEFCIKHRSGEIALFVVLVKSTALWDKPGVSFVMGDLTVWRAT